MKIIVLGPEYSGYIAASYQYEFMNTLKEFSKSFYHYSETSEIDVPNLLKKQISYPILFFIIMVGYQIIQASKILLLAK